jgi:putative peptidoglycan binding protein
VRQKLGFGRLNTHGVASKVRPIAGRRIQVGEPNVASSKKVPKGLLTSAGLAVVIIGALVSLYCLLTGTPFSLGANGIKVYPSLSATKRSASDLAQPNYHETDLPAKAAISVDSLPVELRGDGTTEGALRAIEEMAELNSDSMATIDQAAATLDHWISDQGLVIVTTASSTSRRPEYCEALVALKKCMKAIGKYDGPIDGDIGKLEDAVFSYQRENHLHVDGKVGGKTWSHLRADIARLHGNDGSNTDPS